MHQPADTLPHGPDPDRPGLLKGLAQSRELLGVQVNVVPGNPGGNTIDQQGRRLLHDASHAGAVLGRCMEVLRDPLAGRWQW